MANVKISDLTPTTTLQSTDLLIISSDNGAGYDTRSIEASYLESAGKKRYIANIVQSGGTAPSLTTYRDEFTGGVIASYISAGVYELVGFNSDLALDCEVEMNTEVIVPTYSVHLIITAADTLEIRTYDATNTLSDSILNGNNIFLKITKYL